MAIPWAPIISAGASLIGSIFGGRKQSTTTTSHVDYRRMVREAEAAGFNPLTALRNGGAAGFSVTNSTTPAAPLSARIADGVSGGVNAFLQNFDPYADAQREQGSRLIEAQIANLNASTAELTHRHAMTTRGNGVLSGKKSTMAELATGPDPEPGDRTVTNPWMTGEVNPHYLDAEVFEARYGDSEIAQMIYGARNMWADYTWGIEREIKQNIADAPKKKAAKQAANEKRKARIRRDAYRNASDLYFPPALR